MILSRVARAAAALLAFTALAHEGASAAAVVKVAVPGAKFMMFGSLNVRGAVIGSDRYGPHAKDWEAFIRTPDGAITTFRYPGARWTFGLDINAAGVAVGVFALPDKSEHGYIRAADGSLAAFDVGAADDVTPSCINAGGVVAGSYSADNVDHGFIRTAGGTVTGFDPPGSRDTAVRAMNKDGVIVGDFLDASNKTHGFVRTPDGTITQIDAPGSDVSGTTITAINANGEMAGSYRADGAERFGHAFFRDAAGNFTFFSAGSGDTLTTSIDNDREITGVFFSSEGGTLGYVYTAGGSVTTFKIGPSRSHSVYPYRIVNGGTTAGAVQFTAKKGTRDFVFLRIP